MSSSTDWIDSKRARTLRISNDRESLQLRKLRRSIDNLKNLNDSLLKQEENKVKKNLAKLADTSLYGSYKNIYKPFSPISVQKTCEQALHSSAKDSAETAGSQFSDHLPKFSSFLRQPTKRINCDKKKLKSFMPFSGVDLSMSATAPKPPDAARLSNTYVLQRTSSFVRKNNLRSVMQDPGNISIQEAISIFPSLQKLSSVGDKFSSDKSQLYDIIFEFPAFERRIKELLIKAQEEETKSKQDQSLPNIKPEEMLRCRYLRLSDTNISTLMNLCKESGVHVDIHPHMKESEIDIHTVISPSSHTNISL
uniref:Uncharacterized protein C16orf78 homolog n=1 Tax=Geotrypetes seraphini TaxID=260995 RepID=A0A6P8QP22_GEOSA|nr:uncharacterized protein C16orf78 homolog [Geotrypetes seraphini]